MAYLNLCSKGSTDVIDVKCLPTHVYSEDGFSNTLAIEKRPSVLCDSEIVWTKKTNAIGSAFAPIHLSSRHQSSLKPSIPGG